VVKKWLRDAAGIGLLLVGVLGCLLPVMPGIPFLIAGIGLLGSSHPIVSRGRGWLIRRGWWPAEPGPSNGK
jgi:uncharacterized membrane protein YbaN (DUF454 family)